MRHFTHRPNPIDRSRLGCTVRRWRSGQTNLECFVQLILVSATLLLVTVTLAISGSGSLCSILFLQHGTLPLPLSLLTSFPIILIVGGTTVGGGCCCCCRGRDWSWATAAVGSAASSRTDSLSKLILTCDQRCSLLLPRRPSRRSANCCCCWHLLRMPSSLVASSDSFLFLLAACIDRSSSNISRKSTSKRSAWGPAGRQAGGWASERTNEKAINNNHSCHHSLSLFPVPVPATVTGALKKNKRKQKPRKKEKKRERAGDWETNGREEVTNGPPLSTTHGPTLHAQLIDPSLQFPQRSKDSGQVKSYLLIL